VKQYNLHLSSYIESTSSKYISILCTHTHTSTLQTLAAVVSRYVHISVVVRTGTVYTLGIKLLHANILSVWLSLPYVMLLLKLLLLLL